MHVDIDKAGSTLKEELQELISKAEERICKFIQERNRTKSRRNKIEAIIATENSSFSSMQRDVHNVVFKELQDVNHQKIVNEYSDILKNTNAKVQWATHMRTNIYKQMTEASMYKLLQMREELVIKITDVVEHKFPPTVFPWF